MENKAGIVDNYINTNSYGETLVLRTFPILNCK